MIRRMSQNVSLERGYRKKDADEGADALLYLACAGQMLLIAFQDVSSIILCLGQLYSDMFDLPSQADERQQTLPPKFVP